MKFFVLFLVFSFSFQRFELPQNASMIQINVFISEISKCIKNILIQKIEIIEDVGSNWAVEMTNRCVIGNQCVNKLPN